MNHVFFPTDAPPRPAHGTLFAWPQQYATLEAAFAAGCDVLAYLHGKGDQDQGRGTLKELKELFNMGMFKNGFWSVQPAGKPVQPGAVDVENIIICMVQTDTGYSAGEIEFLLDKIDSYKPAGEVTLMGFSWGGWGILGNVGNGKVDPRKRGSIWLLAPGNDSVRRAAFLAAMKGVDTPVYIVWNQNDTLVKTGVNELYQALKAQGNRVAFVRFRNVWTSSDGSKTSHGVTGWVFPSRWWRMYNKDKVAINAVNYAEVFTNDALLTYNFYEMMKRNLEVGEPEPEPLPADQVVHTLEIGAKVEIIKRADGSLAHKITMQ